MGQLRYNHEVTGSNQGPVRSLDLIWEKGDVRKYTTTKWKASSVENEILYYFFCTFYVSRSTFCKNTAAGTNTMSLLAASEAGLDLKWNLLPLWCAPFPLSSLINHSCDPNVVRHYYSCNGVVRSIRTIMKGEELLDNYGYHYAVMPKEERQRKL